MGLLRAWDKQCDFTIAFPATAPLSQEGFPLLNQGLLSLLLLSVLFIGGGEERGGSRLVQPLNTPSFLEGHTCAKESFLLLCLYMLSFLTRTPLPCL